MIYRKRYTEEFVWGTSLFWLHTLLSMTFFVTFFVYSVSLLSDLLAEWPLCIILPWVVFCVMIPWVNGPKYENLLQFNNSWLASLRTWCYFRPCFSFSCSGYDLVSIKKGHTLNCYLFLQKFLLKAKIYKLVAGKCSSSIYC